MYLMPSLYAFLYVTVWMIVISSIKVYIYIETLVFLSFTVTNAKCPHIVLTTIEI